MRERTQFSRLVWWPRSRALLVAQLLTLGFGSLLAVQVRAQTPSADAAAPPVLSAPPDATVPPVAPPAANDIAPAPVDSAPAVAPATPSEPPPPPPPPPAATPPPPAPPAEAASESSWLPAFTGTRRRMGQYNEIGIFAGNVGSLGVSGRSANSPQVGLRFMEHHGLLTKFSVGLLTALATSGDRVETGRTVERSGDIETTTVYSRSKTEGEREADRQMVESAINGEYVTELVLYTDGIFGSGSGKPERVRGADFYLGGNWSGPFIGEFPSIFDAGLVYSNNHANDALFKDGHRANVEFVNFGVMVRYQIPLTSFFEVLVQADVNVYGLATHKQENRVQGTPLRVGAYVNLSDRLYARPMISYTTGTSGFGKVVEAGFRF